MHVSPTLSITSTSTAGTRRFFVQLLKGLERLGLWEESKGGGGEW
jgi:hypothetical protein